MSSVMKISRNGQVSIPAATRARWGASEVVVVDLGGYLVMRPVFVDPVGEIQGRYAGSGPSTADMRRQARREEAAPERRR